MRVFVFVCYCWPFQVRSDQSNGQKCTAGCLVCKIPVSSLQCFPGYYCIHRMSLETTLALFDMPNSNRFDMTASKKMS